jgi:hypothetical protein
MNSPQNESGTGNDGREPGRRQGHAASIPARRRGTAILESGVGPPDHRTVNDTHRVKPRGTSRTLSQSHSLSLGVGRANASFPKFPSELSVTIALVCPRDLGPLLAAAPKAGQAEVVQRLHSHFPPSPFQTGYSYFGLPHGKIDFLQRFEVIT